MTEHDVIKIIADVPMVLLIVGIWLYIIREIALNDD